MLGESHNLDIHAQQTTTCMQSLLSDDKHHKNVHIANIQTQPHEILIVQCYSYICYNAIDTFATML